MKILDSKIFYAPPMICRPAPLKQFRGHIPPMPTSPPVLGVPPSNKFLVTPLFNIMKRHISSIGMGGSGPK